ncbi:unnamed protein product [Rhizoctonia solani]|uniref:ADP-ribosylation factor-like protein 2 n=1 Tax=Rhizoctonia solani TaxID=456999 RepID=A0A8H3E600_9AGAM|nr:unnamed protein product [Rhizoctonia solani]
MGLLTIIRKNKMKEREMRILFLGLDNAGKTTILKRLKGQDVMSTSPTLGFEISTITYGKYLLNIWDVGGQRTLRPYWRNYFEKTDVLVWVVDSGDRLRMDDCREELHALLQEQRLAGASLLVFANKQDITGSMSDAEIKEVVTAIGWISREFAKLVIGGWFCPFVQRAWIALEEKGIPYREWDEKFIEKFPKGLVPGVLHQGKPIAESLVILEFLEDDLYKGLQSFAKGITGPFWAGEQFTHADIALLPFIVRLPILEAHRDFKRAEVGHGFEAYAERVVNLPSVQRTLSDPERYEEVYGRYLRNETQSEVAKSTRAGRILP